MRAVIRRREFKLAAKGVDICLISDLLSIHPFDPKLKYEMVIIAALRYVCIALFFLMFHCYSSSNIYQGAWTSCP